MDKADGYSPGQAMFPNRDAYCIHFQNSLVMKVVGICGSDVHYLKVSFHLKKLGFISNVPINSQTGAFKSSFHLIHIEMGLVKLTYKKIRKFLCHLVGKVYLYKFGANKETYMSTVNRFNPFLQDLDYFTQDLNHPGRPERILKHWS